MSAFPGASSPYTTDMQFRSEFPIFQCYRVTDRFGKLVSPAYTPSASDELLVTMYQTMVRLNVMDGIFYDAQRQGRLSFYMTCYGEEAIHIGSAAALKPADEVFAQYRETGALMWRGFSLTDFAHQLFSTDLDLGKGKQMPIHYGSRELHYQTVGSCLATQLPHAVGASYAFKLDRQDRVSIVYFGDGAASEGDFHASLNFAAVLKCPVIFFCRNNGYAISTPTDEQYKGDGIASRGPGYGIATIRVDGMDVLAVHEAVTQARAMALAENCPVLIEAMTYRGGHHSTSDDSTRYRSKDEIQWWLDEMSPLTRTRLHLEGKGLWDGAQESNYRAEVRRELFEAIAEAEKRPRPPITELFKDVYKDLPLHLEEQQAELADHMDKYPTSYGTENFLPSWEYSDPAPER